MPQLALLLNFLTIHVTLTLATGCFSSFCNCFSSSSLRDPDDQPPINTQWAVCKNTPAEGQTWACQDPSISFPTVDCLAEDMKKCGNIGTNTVFYSFGAVTTQARVFRDTLRPRGVMFNDALDDPYFEMLSSRIPSFRLDVADRQQVYTARYAEAMARLSTGDVYIVVKDRVGEGGEGEGAYQKPKDDGINVWRSYEFPTLQRNPLITSVISVDIGNDYQRTVDWTPNDGKEILPASNAGSLAIPEVPACAAKFKRDTSACSVPPPCPMNATASSEARSTITAAPTPTCELHGADPDHGIKLAFCLCDNSITLNPLPATSEQSESCAYKSIPTATSAFETVTTQVESWTQNCVGYKLVGGIADIPTKYTTVAGCTPTVAPTPTIAAWVGNLSTIEIGNADDGNGGKDLATEMFGKLKAMCSGTTCKGDYAEMDNVEAAIADGEEPLKPAMYLQDAAFTSQDVLEKMLSVGISSWISALNNSDLNLCKDVTYEAEEDETGSGCGEGPISTSRLRRKTRSDDGAVLWERGGLEAEEKNLVDRCLDTCDEPRVCTYAARMCNAPNEITVVMSDDYGDPYKNHLNIGVTLEESGSDDGFLCELITAELTAAVAALAPELLPEARGLEKFDIAAICGITDDDPASAIESLAGMVDVARRGYPGAPKAVPASATFPVT